MWSPSTARSPWPPTPSRSASCRSAKGGTNATDAANARSNLSVPGKYATSVGDNSSTSITVTHNLGTIDVIVQVHRVASPFDVVECDMQVTDTNTVTLLFATAPTTNQYRCVVHG
jgi:hypothetical protein